LCFCTKAVDQLFAAEREGAEFYALWRRPLTARPVSKVVWAF